MKPRKEKGQEPGTLGTRVMGHYSYPGMELGPPCPPSFKRGCVINIFLLKIFLLARGQSCQTSF